MKTKQVKKIKPYGKLKGLLKENDMTYKELSYILEISASTVANRFANRDPWRLHECYKLLALFSIDFKDLPLYFPENGGV